jgi:hypothetical protein
MAAVRELLQNALDAVKEQIARERLQQDNPQSPSWERKLGELHKVTLSVIQEEDGLWLVCADNGVGMTRRIIERHLLVSGASALPETYQLEREAHAHGFAIQRSGQFGLGVLSYFMIADRMAIATRRSDLAGGDPDNSAWRFETEGVGSFGQLAKTSRRITGTEVRLRIKPAFIDGLKERLFVYLKQTLAYLPCVFELSWLGEIHTVLGPGWYQHHSDLKALFLQGFRRQNSYLDDEALIPADEVRMRDEDDARWTAARAIARERMRFTKPVERDLPDGLGRYRVHICYFDLDGGVSLAFLDITHSRGKLLSGPAQIVVGSSKTLHSWNGFRLAAHPRRAEPSPEIHLREWARIPGQVPVVIEIDWTQAGRISVDRTRLELDDANPKAVGITIRDTIKSIAEDLLMQNASSKYASLNRSVLYRSLNERWLQPAGFWTAMPYSDPEVGDFRWDRLQFPAVELTPGAWYRHLRQKVIWNGGRIKFFYPLKEPGYTKYLSSLLGLPCDRIVMASGRWGLRVVFLWEKEPSVDPGKPRWLTSFPIEWRSVPLVTAKERHFWNRNNSLIKNTTPEDVRWAEEHGVKNISSIADDLLRAPSRAAAWALANLGRPKRFWNGIRDQLPPFFSSLIEILMGLNNSDGPSKQIYAMIYDQRFLGSFEVVALSRGGLVITESYQVKFGHTPAFGLPPRGEWWIDVTPKAVQRAEDFLADV